MDSDILTPILNIRDDMETGEFTTIAHPPGECVWGTKHVNQGFTAWWELCVWMKQTTDSKSSTS